MIGNLPNILTIARILLLPFFAASLIYGSYQYALILFLAAAITDILDGLIARMKKQTTDFGSILDPVADKFLMITSFIVMSVYGWIPKWLTITVISRDLIVVTGWLILYFVTHNKKVEPGILGKAANFFQFCLIGLILISIIVDLLSSKAALTSVLFFTIKNSVKSEFVVTRSTLFLSISKI